MRKMAYVDLNKNYSTRSYSDNDTSFREAANAIFLVARPLLGEGGRVNGLATKQKRTLFEVLKNPKKNVATKLERGVRS